MEKIEANDPINAIYTPETGICAHGLTKREYFAAMAMQGMLSTGQYGGFTAFDIANTAIKTADALILQLNK